MPNTQKKQQIHLEFISHKMDRLNTILIMGWHTIGGNIEWKKRGEGILLIFGGTGKWRTSGQMKGWYISKGGFLCSNVRKLKWYHHFLEENKMKIGRMVFGILHYFLEFHKFCLYFIFLFEIIFYSTNKMSAFEYLMRWECCWFIFWDIFKLKTPGEINKNYCCAIFSEGINELKVRRENIYSEYFADKMRWTLLGNDEEFEFVAEMNELVDNFLKSNGNKWMVIRKSQS